MGSESVVAQFQIQGSKKDKLSESFAMVPATFLPDFLTETEADELFDYLMSNYEFSRRIAMADGSFFEMDLGRKVLVDSDLAGHPRLTEHFGKTATFTGPMLKLKSRIEQTSGHLYRVCVCLLYQDGTKGSPFHQDLVAYGDTDSIPSLNLGATREFVIRSLASPDEQHRYTLTNGSMILMEDGCQENFQHGLLEDPTVTEPRFNLTFRKFDQ